MGAIWAYEKEQTMNIAFLFNSDHPSYGGDYGGPIMELILSAGVLQRAQRHMRVSIGDILTYGAAAQSKTPTIGFLVKLCRAVYSPVIFDRLLRDRLEATHGRATVYCWLFQNMTAPLAGELHEHLKPDDSYLGAMDVNFSHPLHLSFFRNSLIERYRFNERQCSIFYVMADNQGPDVEVQEELENQGFTVSYEDIGARRTIFDDYDNLEHFKRIASFSEVFSQLAGLDTDHISDLVHSLEELHPKLFDAFAAASQVLQRAETEEDYAQAGLSGRRLLESTADYLFPARAEKWNGRNVGRENYKNRLWAYIEQTINEWPGADSSALTRLGKEVDNLVDLFNACVHGHPTRTEAESAFAALVFWLSDVIKLAPAAARRPYLAYEESLERFFEQVMRNDP
jgi:hypothetical protein